MLRLPEKSLTDAQMRKVIKEVRSLKALIYIDEFSKELIIADMPMDEAQKIVDKACGRGVR